ncbi:hypothetical protein OBBRIDRAFT_101360, partial [Obba rivulosa]
MNGIQGVVAKIDNLIAGLAASNNVTQQLISSVSRIEREQTRERCHKWLSPPDPSTNHNTACESHYEGTAKWFIDGEILKEWRMTRSLLWIRGKPGAGKSILCSAIVQDVKDLCRNQPNSSFAYFYCDFSDPAKQNIRGLLSSLLIQLSVQPNARNNTLSHLYSDHAKGLQQPSDTALAVALKHILTDPIRGPVYIVIDALDECPNSSGIPTQRKKILNLVAELTELPANIHMCITSRPEPDIQNVLEPLASHCVTLDAECGQSKDIALYVRSVVSSDEFEQWSKEHKTLAIDALLQKADGMFRWVFCQLDALRPCFPAEITSTLENLPESLDETYRRVLEGINKSHQKHAHRIFQCLMVSTRPHRVEELAEVFAVDFDGSIPQLTVQRRLPNPKEGILRLCSTLVTIDTNTEEVRFAHSSVQEYLESERLAHEENVNIRQFHITAEHAHVVLAQACLSVLLQSDPRNSPLARYAAQHWICHVHPDNISPCIRDALQCLFHPHKSHFTTWIWIHDIDNHDYIDCCIHRVHKPVTPLYYSVMCGLLSLAQHLLVTHSLDPNTQGGHYGTALHAASVMGSLNAVQFLVKRGADVNAQGGRVRHRTPSRLVLHGPSRGGAIPGRAWCRCECTGRQVRHRTPSRLGQRPSRRRAIPGRARCRCECTGRQVRHRTPSRLVQRPSRRHAIPGRARCRCECTGRQVRYRTP